MAPDSSAGRQPFPDSVGYIKFLKRKRKEKRKEDIKVQKGEHWRLPEDSGGKIWAEYNLDTLYTCTELSMDK